METVRELLRDDPLARATTQVMREEVMGIFSRYLPENIDDTWPRVLYPFIALTPWRYWDVETVEKVSALLEKDSTRTIEALVIRAREVSIGIENLMRPSPTDESQESFDITNTRDLLRLSTEFHPEYLRRAEQIYGKLASVYWSILKRKSVEGKFDLPSAISLFSQKGYDFLFSGYDDRIRNAVAHGEVVFTGIGIKYGPEAANYELLTSDFLQEFDSLLRTSNALVVALVLFLARNLEKVRGDKSFRLPLGFIELISRGITERPGLSITGVVESSLPLTGRQLHIAVRTIFQARTIILAECSRIAMNLIDVGATDYSRFLFAVDSGKRITSLAVILPAKLKYLLDNDAPVGHLPEVFDQTQLLWYDEGKLKTSLKVWRIILKSSFERFVVELRKSFRELGLPIISDRYRIREIEKILIGDSPRVNVTAVLKNPFDSEDKEILKVIIHSIVRAASRKWLPAEYKFLGLTIKLPNRPKYVWVNLYKSDGPYRWLRSGGWLSKNLIVQAERIYGRNNPPVMVENPQEISKQVRLRYEIDQELAAKVAADFVSLATEIWNRRNPDKSE